MSSDPTVLQDHYLVQEMPWLFVRGVENKSDLHHQESPVEESGHLLERDEERAHLDALISSARAGAGVALVVTGEAGIGKSSLLEYASMRAEDMTVLRVSGIESEMGLSYAGLHRLLRSHLSGLPGLPVPQRLALQVVFGFEAGPPPSPFLASLATLTLLTDIATQRPVLCVIDDIQWLDHESSEVLAFVARRVLADRIALLFARGDSRNASGTIDGLPTLPVTGLSAEGSLKLLRSTVTADLDYATESRIVAETAGNPLAIVELAGELTGLLPRGESDPLKPLPLTHRLEARFAQSFRALPVDSQRYLLLAAADPTGDQHLLHAAAEVLALSPTAAEDAEEAGLLVNYPQVAFRHPLIRSAVYSSASAVERRHAHLALASVDNSDAGDHLQAWHLGLGVARPDEAVAAELEASAARVRYRSGYSAEASFLKRAAELSTDPAQASRRLLAAAAAAAAAGSQARARALLDRVRSAVLDDSLSAPAQWMHGLFLMHEGRYGDAPAVLLAAARSYQSRQPAQARIVMLDALGAVCLAGNRAIGTSPLEVASAALGMPRSAEATPTMADLLLDGLATRLAVGFAESVPLLRAALQSWAPEQVPAENVTLWCTLGTYAALELLDDIALQSWVGAIERHARDRGSIILLRVVLYGLATAAGLAGRFGEAAAFNNEARQLNAVTGAPAHLNALIDVELLGLQGREAEGRAAARFTQNVAIATGFDTADCRGLLACARLDLASGNYADALVAAQSVADRPTLGAGCLVLPEVVEAGVRSDNRAVATAALAQLTERALAIRTPWSLGLLARSRALLATEDDAEPLYEESIFQLDKTTAVFDLARSRLVYGEWLRRQHRRIDARTQLRTAMDDFISMGAERFAERARAELTATGERPRRRTLDTTNDLTPQEHQIAELAAQRETNREIAARLFISASTVDYHLRSVFQKLGINSRRQLDRALHRYS
jgi:DNA-binding CsgD family transcriptional regulator